MNSTTVQCCPSYISDLVQNIPPYHLVDNDYVRPVTLLHIQFHQPLLSLASRRLKLQARLLGTPYRLTFGALLTLLLFRPHRSTTYVDAVYCYRPNSRSVGLSH